MEFPEPYKQAIEEAISAAYEAHTSGNWMAYFMAEGKVASIRAGYLFLRFHPLA